MSIALIAILGVYSVVTEERREVWTRWHLARVLNFCEATAPIAVPLLGISLIVVNVCLRWLESPQVLNAVHGVLNEIQRSVFGNAESLPEHQRRVTLFKYVWWRWTLSGLPWGGWLVAVERSGETTRSRVSAFRASKSRPAEAQGLAGQAFANGGVFVTGPGLLPAVNLQSPEDELADYAKQTYVSVDWVKRWLKSHPKQQAPRGICAIPVTAGGRRWGVLVLDGGTEIKYSKTVNKKQFTLFSGLLGQLLAK